VDRTDVLGQRTGVGDPGETQRTPEGATPLRQREAGRIRMHMCSPTRQPANRIGLELRNSSGTDRDEPQQFDGRRALSTTDAGAHR
jgi:hypothetical protein